jgi:hypothetical protein
MFDTNTATAAAVDILRDAKCVAVLCGGDGDFAGFIGSFIRVPAQRPTTPESETP